MSIETLRTAFDLTETRIAAITDDQWELPTPCSEWDVRALVNHTIGAVMGMGLAAAGQAPPAGEAPDFTAGDASIAFRQAADTALAAWPGALDRAVDLGPVQLPGSVAMGVSLMDCAVHGWDIARATGQDAELPDDLATAVMEAAKVVVTDDLRGTAGFAPAIETGAGASTTDRLVAFTGRQP